AGKASHLVGAGQSWGCDPRPLPGLTATTAEPPRAAPTPARAVSESRAESRALRIQNQLFQRALHAQRAGENQLARETYRAFLQRYPDAPLAAQARANLAAIPPAR
ncbi:MAG TPA: hypothetical protein VGF45_10085, partial [Polyangia bacterium]